MSRSGDGPEPSPRDAPRDSRPAPLRDLPPVRPEREAGSDLGDRLHSAAIRLLRWLRQADRTNPLPAARLSALSVIVYAGPLSLKALAEAEQVRPPTMSRIVAKLVEAGLVRRERDPDDRRSVCIGATTRGRAILDAGRRQRLRLLEGALERLGGDERAALEAGVEVIERLPPGEAQ